MVQADPYGGAVGAREMWCRNSVLGVCSRGWGPSLREDEKGEGKAEG